MKKAITILILPLLLCCFLSAFAQERIITGKVTDAGDGSPLPGVSIMVKGSNSGTSSDANGVYRLRIPGQNAVLVFKFIGYITKEVPAGSGATLNVSLSGDNQQLSEVVVTALGIKRSERSLGYSTQQVKGEDLTLTKEQNVLGSLAGKIAGVQVVGASGASMGGTAKIKIRGVNSLTGTDQPLIVVDGTPISNDNYGVRSGADYGNISQDINPDDVESVNVLKGPAASALYGLRGQYGVVLITTKKGAKGPKKVDVQFTSAASIEKAGNFMPLQNLYGAGGSQTFRTLANGDKYVDFSYDESWGPKMDGTPVRQVFSFYPQDPEYGKLTPFVPHPDNVKNFFETGVNLNNGLSVAGGNENSSFRLSYNNAYITGIEPNTWLKRNNLGVNGSLDLTKKLTVSTDINYATNNAQRPSQGYDGGSRNFVQWFERNLDMKRLKNYKYADGTFLQWNIDRPSADGTADLHPLYWNNPYFEAYENLNIDNRDHWFGNVGLTYQLLPELKLSGFVRSDMYTQNIEEREATGSRYVSGFTTGKYQNNENNFEFLGQYSKTWGGFSLNANLGANILKQKYTYLYEETQGGLSSPGFYNIAASIDRPITSSYLRRKEVRSLYGMVSLGFKDTYFIDASLRNDNSSTLPTNNNSYWYPSLSGSLVFSELVKWHPLSFGKLRVSYAQAGSDLSPYQTAFTYGVGGIYSGTNSLYLPDNLINPDIKPSFANSYEGGLDLRFLNNRVGIDFTYYMQRNKNQIISLDVSGTSGYTSTIINAGLIENKGFEIALTGSPVRSKKFSWEAALNLSRNRSMVKELYPGTDVYNNDVNTYAGVSAYLNSYVGEPFGSLVGKAYQRDPATGKILLDADNLPMYTAATHNFGSVLPDLTGGFQNTFRLGKVDLGAMIDYQWGGQFFSWSKMLAVKSGQAAETAVLNDNGKNVRDPVAEGGGVKVTGISAATGQEVTAYVDARQYFRNRVGTQIYEEWLYDASYIKLRELRLGYTLDKKQLGKVPFNKVNLAFIVRNPAMLWQKAPKGIDPSELSTGSGSSTGSNHSPITWLETGQLNTVRSYGLNLNITF